MELIEKDVEKKKLYINQPFGAKGGIMDWIPVKEYATLMGISTQAVDKQIKNGSIPEDRVEYRKSKRANGLRYIRHIKLED